MLGKAEVTTWPGTAVLLVITAAAACSTAVRSSQLIGCMSTFLGDVTHVLAHTGIGARCKSSEGGVLCKHRLCIRVWSVCLSVSVSLFLCVYVCVCSCLLHEQDAAMCVSDRAGCSHVGRAGRGAEGGGQACGSTALLCSCSGCSPRLCQRLA